MFLQANQDIYGNNIHFSSDDFRKILDLIDRYMSTPYDIREIRQDDANDANGRIDVEVEYKNSDGYLIRQKLLILKGELIDGETFHKRYHEWY